VVSLVIFCYFKPNLSIVGAFALGYIPVLPKTFSGLTELVGLVEPEKIAAELSTVDFPISVDMRSIDFLRRHVDWTYEILKAAEVDEQIVKIAAAHHILEDKNPAQLNVAEIGSSTKFLELTDKYQAYLYRILALVDKFDAFLGRGEQEKTHIETIAALQRKVNESNLSPEVKEEYEEIIRTVFENSERELSIRAQE
jgi:response regulator RpfG family c-di-GMP phosphodiesterase